MAIRVYHPTLPSFTVENPARLMTMLDGVMGDYTFDAEDLAAWERERDADHVRREAARRMIALVGARDERHLNVLISNAQREALRLLKKGEANWTPEEVARAAEFEQIDAAIEAIRAASNAMEAENPVPTGAAMNTDPRWPA